MNEKSVFEFKSYKSYLEAKTGEPGTRKGLKASLAKAADCQPTYISQVLHGKAHLSLEQAEKLNRHFSHSKEERQFFLLLVQKERAGTTSLRDHFDEGIRELLDRRLVLTKRLGAKVVLDQLSQSTYYSSWIFAAVHIALTIPELRTREALSNHLAVPIAKITETLEFLISVNLALQVGSEFHVGESQIRLGNDSKNILKHHSNWRIQALESFDRESLTDFHYSGVVSLSTADVIRVKNLFLEVVKDSQAIVKDSKEEALYSIGIDFFTLKKHD